MKVTTQTYSLSQLSEWPESDPTMHVHATFDAVESSSGHLKYDYLIKYAYFDKMRFEPINDPENWTTNVA